MDHPSGVGRCPASDAVPIQLAVYRFASSTRQAYQDAQQSSATGAMLLE
jgi:hypothetical protein